MKLIVDIAVNVEEVMDWKGVLGDLKDHKKINDHF